MSNGEDRLKQRKTHVRWSRLNHDLPGGLHRPKRKGDIGWDLECMEDVEIPPMGRVDVPVNARLWLPDGFYADIRNRSSMSKRNLYVDQNLLDTGYRGPIYVLIRNLTLPQMHSWDGSHYWDFESGTVTLKAGERIAQLVFHTHHPVWEDEVHEVPLDTERAEAGFGSTGR